VADRGAHRGAAAIVGLGVGVYVAWNEEGWPVVARLLGAVVGSLLGASLPDLIEPAIHSWHRGSFHSWAALAGSTTLTLGPPAAFRQWVAQRETAAERWRMQREVRSRLERARALGSTIIEPRHCSWSSGVGTGR
jgi:hypothetical protein